MSDEKKYIRILPGLWGEEGEHVFVGKIYEATDKIGRMFEFTNEKGNTDHAWASGEASESWPCEVVPQWEAQLMAGHPTVGELEAATPVCGIIRAIPTFDEDSIDRILEEITPRIDALLTAKRAELEAFEAEHKAVFETHRRILSELWRIQNYTAERIDF